MRALDAFQGFAICLLIQYSLLKKIGVIWLLPWMIVTEFRLCSLSKSTGYLPALVPEQDWNSSKDQRPKWACLEEAKAGAVQLPRGGD